MEWILQRKNNKATDDMVRDVEIKLGVRFPKDFVECAKENGGASPYYDGIDLPNFKGTIVSRILSFNPESKYGYILNNQNYEGLPNGFVIIALSEGDVFCYDFTQDMDNPPIVYIHGDTRDIYKAFPTFTELVNNLREIN